MLIADHIVSAEPVRTGSQVYKAIRSDGIQSAIHIFPFKMTTDQYEHFRQQMIMLAEVVTEDHAAIPQPLSWGTIQSGAFAYMEMEWIDGNDLDEKNNPAGDSNFSIKDLMIVAEQISRVLALCHKLHLYHGSVIEKNILWDRSKQRYVLTGFNFGFIDSERIAPGQNTGSPGNPGDEYQGDSLPQKDMYGLGKVLLHLLVRYASIEEWNGIDWNARDFHLPISHLSRTEAPQSNIPVWLINTIRRCLSPDAEEQFANVAELYSYVLLHHKTPLERKAWYRSTPQQKILPAKAVRPASNRLSFNDRLNQVKELIQLPRRPKMRFVFDQYIAGGLVIAILLTGFTIGAQKERSGKKQMGHTPASNERPAETTVDLNHKDAKDIPKKDEPPPAQLPVDSKRNPEKVIEKQVVDSSAKTASPTTPTTSPAGSGLGAYKVRSKAYFHNQPDESTRRNAFIVHWNNAVLIPKEEQNDFIYIVFTNHLGQTSKGWLRKKDLIRIEK